MQLHRIDRDCYAVIWLIDEDANKGLVVQERITIVDYYSRRALPITKHYARIRAYRKK